MARSRRVPEEVIGHFDDLDREVILLRHFEQFGNADVARAPGLSEPAAGMRHLRAVRRLRARRRRAQSA